MHHWKFLTGSVTQIKKVDSFSIFATLFKMFFGVTPYELVEPSDQEKYKDKEYFRAHMDRIWNRLEEKHAGDIFYQLIIDKFKSYSMAYTSFDPKTQMDITRLALTLREPLGLDLLSDGDGGSEVSSVVEESPLAVRDEADL